MCQNGIQLFFLLTAMFPNSGLLLLSTKSEEISFWLLKVLVEKILPDYYTKTMDGLIVDIEVLSELVKAKAPDVHQHVINLGS